MIYAKKGDKSQALRYLSIAVSTPTRPYTKIYAYQTAYEVAMDFAEYEKAEEYLEKGTGFTIPGSPYYIEMQERKAMLLAKTLKIEKCLETVRYILDRKPLSWRAILANGIVRIHVRQYEAAFEDFGLCLKYTKDVLIYIAKGEAYLEMENHQKALIEVDEALKINPHHPSALQLKQKLLPSTGRPNEPSNEDRSSRPALPSRPSPGLFESSSGDALPQLETPIFSERFNYQVTFKKFRSEILDFISGKKNSEPAELLVVRLISYSMSKVDQAILVDAFEFVKVKIAVFNVQVAALNKCIALVDLADATKRTYVKRSAQILEVTNQYIGFLREKLTNSTDDDESAILRNEHDTCLVFLAGLKKELEMGSKWTEKAFFSNLTEQMVSSITSTALYDPKMRFLDRLPRASILAKHTLEGLWHYIWDKLHARIVKKDYTDRVISLQTEQSEMVKKSTELLNAFKFFLKPQKKQTWKEAWLNQPNSLKSNFGGKAGNSITGSFHMSSPIEFPKRFVSFDEPAGGGGSKLSAVIGSTYFSTAKPLDATTKELILDANYQIGSTGAIADGLGHFKSDELNKTIHFAAYRACKLGTRYANLYTDPGTLYAEIFPLFCCLGVAVKQSFLQPHEAGTTTLLLTKVFPTKEKKEKILVSAGIGDCMGFMYTPSTNKLHILSKPRQYERGGQYSPISLTEKLEPGYIQKSWHKVDDDSFIFRMTDGAWELLPHTVAKLPDLNRRGRFYLEYTPDIEALTEILNSFCIQNPNANPRDFRLCLFHLIQKTLKERREKLCLYQQITEPKFQFYSARADSKNTIKSFLSWSKDNDTNFYDLFLASIGYLNYDLASIEESTLDEFKTTISSIQFGDDVALHVESIYPFEELSPGSGIGTPRASNSYSPLSGSPSSMRDSIDESGTAPPSRPKKALSALSQPPVQRGPSRPSMPPRRAPVPLPSKEDTILFQKMATHSVRSISSLKRPNTSAIKPSIDIHQCIHNAVGSERFNSASYKSLVRAVTSHLETNIHVKETLQSCPEMTPNDIGALIYYTSDIRKFGGKKKDSIYVLLNNALSSKETAQTQCWSSFMYYALQAKKYLKSWQGTAYRGIDQALTSLSAQYIHDAVVVWDAFTSTTTSDSLVQAFSEPNCGTWMVIEVKEGYQLPFSLFPVENEVLLFPNSSFRVTALVTNEIKKLLKFPVGLDVIHFRQE